MEKFVIGLWLGIIGMSLTADAMEWKAAWDTLWGYGPRAIRVKEESPGPVTYVDPAAPAVKMGRGVIRVTGYGAAPAEATSPVQAELMAVGAARLDAQRQLAAILKGSSIDAHQTASSYQQTDYTVRESSSGFLKGVHVLDTRLLEDGSAEVDVELVLAEADAEAHLESLEGYRLRRVHSGEAAEDLFQAFGPSETDSGPSTPSETPEADTPQAVPAVEGAAPEADPSASLQTAQLAPPAPRPSPADPMLAWDSVAPTGEDFTDLVLDARGLDAQPALKPRVFLKDGRQLYPLKEGVLAKVPLPKEPELRYATKMEEIESLPGFGGRPLVVPVAEVSKDGADLILSGWDARKLKELKGSRITRGQGYVVFLID